MKLTLKERILVPRLYPLRESLFAQLLVRHINEKIQIEDKEAKKVGLKFEQGIFTWNLKKTIVKDFEFTDSEINFLKEQVKRVDKEKSITPDMVDLCVKIRDYEVKK